MKLWLIAGGLMLSFLAGTAIAANRDSGKAGFGYGQSAVADRVLNRMAGQFQGYFPDKNQIRISGKDYEMAPDLKLNPNRFRTNQMVTFEVSGEFVSGREIITNIE